MRKPDGIEVSHTELRAAAEGIVSVGQDIAVEAEIFAAEPAGRPDVWGDGDLGSLIGPIYAQLRNEALEAYAALADGIREAGTIVGTMSVNHAAAESAAEEAGAAAVPDQVV
ncbi:hypothetical protein [Microtetraspora fusca]|uniref:PE domain-containing protein n=1 Tax=Microtetraspora fusca TaxID=1997 RepID=A0ABW6V4Q7_MICFU|nr:hypothetical protein [Microtetraspora fusca]